MEADQIIAEIARTTGLRLDKADPILAAAVVNEILLDQALVKLDRQVKVQADRVTAASTQAVLDAKKEAALLITDAGEWIESKIKAAGETATKQIQAELQIEVQKAKDAERAAVRAALLTGFLGLAVLSGFVGILLAQVR
jgi:hypothetical protein